MIEVAGIKLYAYGLMIGLGIWAAAEASWRVAKRRKIKEKTFNQLLIWTVIGGIIGARLYHVIDFWSYYQDNLQLIWQLWQGGLGIWGAVTGGGATILIFQRIKGEKEKTKLKDWWDISAVGVPLGQAIGRWGNFFNEELYGKVTDLPWGWQVTTTGEKHHPLFLYESLLNLILFLLLWKQSKKKTKPGEISGMYLMGYGLIRFGLEWLRPETVRWQIGGIPVAVIAAVISFSFGLAFYLRSRKQS